MVGVTRPSANSTTSTTSTIEIISVISTSCTLSRMVMVRSARTSILVPVGIQRVSCGSSALMPSTTSMTLASGCFWMMRITAGLLLYQPACRLFSAPSTTRATSESRSAVPVVPVARMSGA